MFVLKDKRFLENSYYYLDGVIFLIEPLLDYFQFVCEFVLCIRIRWHGTQSSWISIRLIGDVILVEFEARVIQNFAPKRSYVRLKVVFEVQHPLWLRFLLCLNASLFATTTTSISTLNIGRDKPSQIKIDIGILKDFNTCLGFILPLF